MKDIGFTLSYAANKRSSVTCVVTATFFAENQLALANVLPGVQ
jgi:hypothetical protein